MQLWKNNVQKGRKECDEDEERDKKTHELQ